MTAKFKTRDEWLAAAAETLAVWIKEHGGVVPKGVRCSCGIAKGKGADKAIGICYHGEGFEDGLPQVWICPTQGDDLRVLDILLHELIHCATPGEKHGGDFKRIAKALGLCGKMTATYAEEGSYLHDRLVGLSQQLGPYPHSVMKPVLKIKKESKRQQVRLYSPENKDFSLQMRKVRFEMYGPPLDPWGNKMVLENEEDAE